MAGFLLTLGDQKAVLFYLSFFPAFLDLSRLSVGDAVIVVAIAMLAVGGVKLSYAWIAAKASSQVFKSTASQRLSLVAGTIMFGTGIGLLLKS